LKADEQVDRKASGKVGADLSGRGCIDAVGASVNLRGFEPEWYLQGIFRGTSAQVGRAEMVVHLCLPAGAADGMRTRII
jgi:hypothetical protein